MTLRVTPHLLSPDAKKLKVNADLKLEVSVLPLHLRDVIR